ncbi:hypothetical protein JYB64_01925 [Algoriphagus aestuarii]|nr:hypothetical protein [Algoriphagus aestuarii]
MGKIRIVFVALLLFSCNKNNTHGWVQTFGNKNTNNSFYIFIPLENSCGSCQKSLGECLSKNHVSLKKNNLQFVLLGKDDFTLQDYKQQYLSSFPFIFEDKELHFLNSNYLEGEYPYFKIKLLELKDGVLVQNISLEPGSSELIFNQLESFFK